MSAIPLLSNMLHARNLRRSIEREKVWLYSIKKIKQHFSLNFRYFSIDDDYIAFFAYNIFLTMFQKSLDSPF